MSYITALKGLIPIAFSLLENTASYTTKDEWGLNTIACSILLSIANVPDALQNKTQNRCKLKLNKYICLLTQTKLA